MFGTVIHAQSIDSLMSVGEEFYHQKKYWKARNTFYHLYKKDKTNAAALSNLLLSYYKTDEHHSAYKQGLEYFKENKLIPEKHKANIYHNFALNCEALDFVAESLHYYEKSNSLKNHQIRVGKIETLRSLVKHLNTIIPKIESKLPNTTFISEELKQVNIPSHHPIPISVKHYIISKMELLHSSFEVPLKIDSTVHFSPLRIQFFKEENIYCLTTKVQFQWWKNDYQLTIYTDHQGQIIDLPIANQVIEDILKEDEETYIISSYYYPRGHAHWQIYTLYQYNRLKQEVKSLADGIKF